jgi:hypothetical protein
VELEQFAGRVQLDYVTDVSLAEMTRRVAAAPPDSLVMPISAFPRLHRAELLIGERGLDLRGRCPRADARDIGELPGTLGPWAVSRSGSPTRAGRRGSWRCRYSTVIDPRRWPEAPGNVCAVDWRELRRWNIPVEQVPADCEVRYREYSYWEQNRAPSSRAGAVILLQAFLITILVLQHRQRRRVEREAQAQRSQLAHAARLATVGELTASIAHEINQPLGAILSNADAAEILLESPSPTSPRVRQILADIRRDDERASAVIQRLRGLLARHELDRRGSIPTRWCTRRSRSSRRKPTAAARAWWRSCPAPCRPCRATASTWCRS